MTNLSTARLATKEDIAEENTVSLRTVETWMANGIIRFYKIGSLVRFDPDEVVADLKKAGRRTDDTESQH